MFTDLYLQTTDPNLPISKLISAKMLFSVLFHTILYCVFFNTVSYIFFGRILSNVVNTRLGLSLFAIMFFGFFARVIHVKEIYSAYNYDLQKTRLHLDKLYISWIFIS